MCFKTYFVAAGNIGILSQMQDLSGLTFSRETCSCAHGDMHNEGYVYTSFAVFIFALQYKICSLDCMKHEFGCNPLHTWTKTK